MPIQLPRDGGTRAVFAGRCDPEDADGLLDWLRRTPDAEADLAACTDLHTALAQLLFAGRVRLAAPPADRVLAECLHAAGLPAAGLAPAIAAPKPQPRQRKPRPSSARARSGPREAQP
jgi:hypothetical protein